VSDEGSTIRRFNPREHLVRINNRGEYLEVKWRLAWFRDVNPEGTIVTELIELRGEGEKIKGAIFKATVTSGNGGSATGHGSETSNDFGDYLEKAETKAIGRALAALGYGTQFTDDFTMPNPDGSPHVVDAPVERRGGVDGRPGPADAALVVATERQVKFIYALAGEVGLDETALGEWSQELFGSSDIASLSRRDAGVLIDALQRRRNEQS
jgi:hypothetical protein